MFDNIYYFLSHFNQNFILNFKLLKWVAKSYISETHFNIHSGQSKYWNHQCLMPMYHSPKWHVKGGWYHSLLAKLGLWSTMSVSCTFGSQWWYLINLRVCLMKRFFLSHCNAIWIQCRMSSVSGHSVKTKILSKSNAKVVQKWSKSQHWPSLTKNPFWTHLHN
jgi:hypothetical protein